MATGQLKQVPKTASSDPANFSLFFSMENARVWWGMPMQLATYRAVATPRLLRSLLGSDSVEPRPKSTDSVWDGRDHTYLGRSQDILYLDGSFPPTLLEEPHLLQTPPRPQSARNSQRLGPVDTAAGQQICRLAKSRWPRRGAVLVVDEPASTTEGMVHLTIIVDDQLLAIIGAKRK